MKKTSSNYIQALLKAGLNQNEADIYTYLLEHGKTNIQQLLQDTGIKRGNLYHILYALRDQNLVIQTEENKKLHFQLNDPASLRTLLENQRQKTQENIREVESLLPELISTYTLTSNKPGIVLFEGEEAMRHILEDALTAEDDILQYVDLEAVINIYPELNKLYNHRRAILKKKKRMILPNTKLSREYASTQKSNITEVRLVDYELPKFSTVMQIYNNKVSYLTLRPQGMIGAIIEDELIAKMHRALFEFNWSIAKDTLQKV